MKMYIFIMETRKRKCQRHLLFLCSQSYASISQFGSMLNKTVIVIGNGNSDPSSNPGWDCFTLCYYPWVRHGSLLAMNK